MRPQTRLHPWLMVGPTVFILGAFVVLPVGLAAVMSFFSWDLLTPPRSIGSHNYIKLIESGNVAAIAGRTLLFSILVTTGAVVLGVGLALLTYRRGRLFDAVRTFIFSAYVMSWVAVALLWMGLLDPDGGAVATLLQSLGVAPGPFLSDSKRVLVTLAGITLWKIAGYGMVICLAALRGVPKDLVEAATLDGAGVCERFQHVTWPWIRPTVVFLAVTSLAVSFQTFDVVRIVTQGGPAKASTLFVYAIYEQIFLDFRVGRASALTVFFFLMLLALAGLQMRAWQQIRERPDA